MICKDGNPCHRWFNTQGLLICRHGLASKDDGSTTTSMITRYLIIYISCPIQGPIGRT